MCKHKTKLAERICESEAEDRANGIDPETGKSIPGWLGDTACIAKARELYGCEGEIEVDSNAVVSRGSDPGAYVQAWVWVPFEEGSEEAEHDYSTDPDNV